MTRTLALAFAVLAGCLAATARAQPMAGDDQAAADRLVEQAAQAYDQNQLDEAVRLLSRAYDLSPRPSILYNRAQVLRTKDDCAGALKDYALFVQTAPADDANRARALRRRDEMQACVDRQAPPPAPAKLALPAAPPPVASTAATETLTARVHEPHPPVHRRAWKVGGWALIGVGALAAGASALFAWQAHHIQDDLDQKLQDNKLRWSSAFNPQYRDGQSDATRAWWCAGAAVLSAGGGAALLLLAPSSSTVGAATAQLRPPLLGWSGTF